MILLLEISLQYISIAVRFIKKMTKNNTVTFTAQFCSDMTHLISDIVQLRTYTVGYDILLFTALAYGAHL